MRHPARPPAAPGSRLRFMVRALSHRNYRLFFSGQGVSLIGTWITRVAPLYRERGILPPIAAGLAGASALEEAEEPL